MPKIPIITGKKAIAALSKIGYQPTRQKGSHVRLLNKIDHSRDPITIPLHAKTLGKGLLRKILRDAKISVEEFVDLLK